MVVQVAERPLGIGDIDPPRWEERHSRGKPLAEHAEPDDQIGDDQIGPPLLDSRADAPGQKFGIPLNVGDEGEELLGRVRNDTLFRMGGHVGET